MTYEEKRELRLQISQLLADAGLNQKTIKDMVNKTIQDKVDRAVDQCLANLDAQCSSGDYILDRVRFAINNAHTEYRIAEALKNELKNRVIHISLKDVSVEEENK